MKKVCLSEPGVACCAGTGIAELWKNLLAANQDGIKKVSTCSGKEFFAGRIEDALLAKRSSARYDMRLCRIEEAALEQIAGCVEEAKKKFGARRIGVCVGSCDNGTELSLAAHAKFFAEGKFPSGYSLEVQGADYPATFAREKFGLEGPALAFSTACSSSACAMARAAELLNSGLCDAVIAGGVDIASDTVLLGFDSLEAVSPRITNPFSKNRSGITLGEAASFFVMSREPLCGGTGVHLLGFGESCDAHHMTSPEPSGRGAAQAMQAALKSAGISPADVDYVNLHGTGTKFNDSMEAKAVDSIFGGKKVAASSTKPLTGHTLGAAGALEAAVCFAAIRSGSLPPQVWDGEADSDLPELNFIGLDRGVRPERIEVCLSNSFAFGGANSCLAIGR